MSEKFKYNYLLVREYQHWPRVYYWVQRPLADYYHIEIHHTKTGKYVYFYSRIHVNELTLINPSFSNDFTDHEIIKDVSGKIAYRFGIEL
jgi:hypothetical protein